MVFSSFYVSIQHSFGWDLIYKVLTYVFTSVWWRLNIIVRLSTELYKWVYTHIAQFVSTQGGAANFCMQKFLPGLAGLVYFSFFFHCKSRFVHSNMVATWLWHLGDVTTCMVMASMTFCNVRHATSSCVTSLCDVMFLTPNLNPRPEERLSISPGRDRMETKD